MGEAELAMKEPAYFAHPTALISPKAKIGAGSKIWAYAQVREGAVIGRNCMIGNGAYIDAGVKVGDRVNIHNKALLYRNLVVEDDVFIGPGVCFVNDPTPRANRIRNLKGLCGRVGKGASVGANASILSEVRIGRYAMVGAASLVTDHVPEFALVYGVPARRQGTVDIKGKRKS
jgi:UDP-3-O-[3-hydroxymyristoyl] glucosamine N-acyltransferase